MAARNSEVNNGEVREQLEINSAQLDQSIAKRKGEQMELEQKLIVRLQKRNEEQIREIKILEQKLECLRQNREGNVKEQTHKTIQSNVKYSTNVSEKCCEEVVRKENSKKSQNRPFNRYQKRFENNRNDRIKIVNENKFRKILNIRELLKGTYTLFKFDKNGRRRFQVRDKRTHENVTNFIAYLKYRFHLWLAKNCSSAEDCICTNCRHAKILNCSNPALCQRRECIFRRRVLAKRERDSIQREDKFVAVEQKSRDIYDDKIEKKEEIEHDKNTILVPQILNKQTNRNLISTPRNKDNEMHMDDSGIGLDDSFVAQSLDSQNAEQKTSQSKTSEICEKDETYNSDQKGMINILNKYAERITGGSKDGINRVIYAQSVDKLTVTAVTIQKIKLKCSKSKSVYLKAHDFMKTGDKVRITKNTECNQEVILKEEIKEIDKNGQIQINLKNISDGPIIIKKNERIAILQLIEDD